VDVPQRHTALPDLVRRRLTIVGPRSLAGGLVAVVLTVLVAWWLLQPDPAPVEAAIPLISGAPVTASASVTTSAPLLVVHVAGSVNHPGLYRLPAGARLADAIAAAGGPTVDARVDDLNLAALVVDASSVRVPSQADPPTVVAAVSGGLGGSGGSGTAMSVGPLDLNTATVEQFDQLPGVGPATAAAIVEYRERVGRFTSVDQLDEVPGIGPTRLERLRDEVVVS
jgi:competence protein ComEA